MVADVGLLRKAHWHRRRRHYRKARVLESMAFDNTEGPITEPVVVGRGQPIERVVDALWMAGAGAVIVVAPSHTERL